MIHDLKVMKYLRDDSQYIEIELSSVAHMTHTICGIAHSPLNDKISAAKVYLLFKKWSVFYIELKLLLQILLIQCRNLHMICVFITHRNIAMIYQFARCWISTANLELVDQLAWKLIARFINNWISSSLKNEVISCSIINNLFYLSW